MKDNVRPIGDLIITLRDSNGNIKEERSVPNLVVTVGKTAIASRLIGPATAVMSHMALGLSATTPAAGNTTLGAESARVVFSATPTAVTNEITYNAMFGAGVGTGSIVEAAIFNAVTSGVMLCRTTFAAVNKDVGDSLTIVWKVAIL